MNAYREWDVHVWSAADLGLDPRSLESPGDLPWREFPAAAGVGEEFRGDAADIAHEVVMALRLQKLVG